MRGIRDGAVSLRYPLPPLVTFVLPTRCNHVSIETTMGASGGGGGTVTGTRRGAGIFKFGSVDLIPSHG